MNEIKAKTKERWEKVKTWVREHKKVIIYGSLAVGLGAVAAVVVSTGNESCKEQDENSENLFIDEVDGTDKNYDDFKDIDRYVLDTDLVNQLPSGTYDLFDMYENQRVDYVVNEKEPMET